MGLFSRKRRYSTRRHKRLPTLKDNLVWAVEPDTAREIVAILLILFGLLFGLGLFGLAGALGNVFFGLSDRLFGVLSYIAPFVLAYIGIRLMMMKSDVLRATSIIGVVLLFLLVPAMFGTSGGSIGVGVIGVYRSVLGNVGGFIALIVSVLVAFMLAFSLSFRQIWERLNLGSAKQIGVKIN